MTLSTRHLAHAIHLSGGKDFLPADNYVTLLPGESRKIRCEGPLEGVCAASLKLP